MSTIRKKREGLDSVFLGVGPLFESSSVFMGVHRTYSYKQVRFL